MKEPIAYVNGLFYLLRNANVSVLDRGFCYGDGIFETMRAYGNKVFKIENHIERLFTSAALIFLELPMTRGEVKKAICETLERNGYPDAVIRLTISRGEHYPGLSIDPTVPPTVVILVRPFEPLPSKFHEEGIKVSLFANGATRTGGLKQQVKSCNYLSQIIIRELSSRSDAYEVILLDDQNRIAEGTVSNIFIVKNGSLKTPKLNEYILSGVTRQVVLDIARDQGITCLEKSLTREDIYEADEVFLTNTAIELLPVRMADEKVIGHGRPGKLTRLLISEFSKTVDACG